MLRALGYKEVERFHMNEGHASLLSCELLAEQLGDRPWRKPTDEDAAAIGDPSPPGSAEDRLAELSDANAIDFFPPGYGDDVEDE